jgi:hypothetical protein
MAPPFHQKNPPPAHEVLHANISKMEIAGVLVRSMRRPVSGSVIINGGDHRAEKMERDGLSVPIGKQNSGATNFQPTENEPCTEMT